MGDLLKQFQEFGTAPHEYWDVYFDTTEAVKKRFDEAGVTIPFPQRGVHLYQHGAS